MDLRFKPTWLLFTLWGVAAFLAYYREQNPSQSVELFYAIAFYGAFILSFGYLFWRMRQRQGR